MLKNIFFFIAITFFAIHSSAHPQIMNVGTNSIMFTYEDLTLPTNVCESLAKEVTSIWTQQPQTLIDIGENGEKRLFNDSFYTSPINNSIEIPNILLENSTNLTLNIPKSYSDAYVIALNKYQAEINLISSLNSFVEKLTPEKLALLSNDDLISLLSPAFKITSLNESSRVQLISDLSSAFYGVPSIMSINQTPSGAFGITNILYTAGIPSYDRESESFFLAPTVFIDGKWKLHPLF